MGLTGSYDVKTFSTTSEGEIRRLNAQLDLFWNKEFALYTRFGLKDGMTILDCGSGPGYLSEKLLHILPGSRVTALEMDPSLVETARIRLLQYIDQKRCTVVQNSIQKMDLPNNTFDFVIARLVVEHVPDPLAACSELFRVVKPGGTVVVIDNDFDMHVRTYPHIPELNDLYNAYCKARSDAGGNPTIGRELPVLLKRTGFAEIDLEIINAHSAIIGDGPFLKSEGPGIPVQLVETGYLAAETYKKITAKWHDMLKNDNHVIVRQLYLSAGKKSSGSTGQKNELPQDQKKNHVLPVQTESDRQSSNDVQSRVAANEKYETLIELIKKHIAGLLATIPVESIKDDIPLTDMGVDSEMATDLQESLSAVLNLKKPLPATLVFDYPTVQAIAAMILENMRLPGDHTSPSEKNSTGSTTENLSEVSDEEIERKLREKLDSLDKE